MIVCIAAAQTFTRREEDLEGLLSVSTDEKVDADLHGSSSTAAEKLRQIKEEHKTWETKFVSHADAYLQELCADPTRQDYPSCAKFNDPSTAAEKFRQIKEEHKAWETEFVSHADAYLRELCADPLRKGYPACAQFNDGVVVERDIMNEIAALREELCADPARQDSSTCMKYREAKDKSTDIGYTD